MATKNTPENMTELGVDSIKVGHEVCLVTETGSVYTLRRRPDPLGEQDSPSLFEIVDGNHFPEPTAVESVGHLDDSRNHRPGIVRTGRPLAFQVTDPDYQYSQEFFETSRVTEITDTQH
ncbi:MAG: hypothetical protein WD049_00035 [Candidatus Paceibacterota bacterium]